MPTLKAGTMLPTLQEDAFITKAAMSDPDCVPYSDEEWDIIMPTIKRGRPPAATTKERITIRLSREVVEAFRTTGHGWQTKIDSALKDWLQTHPR
jgi:uncharacterized protein (DUF4415 family)